MGIVERQVQLAARELILPRYDDLPRLGLYLEQVTRYVNSTFDRVPDLHLSSTTVSSYVKRGLVEHPQNRRYGRDQLARLIFIAACRRAVGADDLHFLLQVQERTHDFKTAYDYFCAKLEENYNYAFGLRPDLPEIGTEDSEEKRVLDNLLRMVACQLYLRSYLDQARENHNS